MVGEDPRAMADWSVGRQQRLQPPQPDDSLCTETVEAIGQCAEWVARHGDEFEDYLRAKHG